MSRLTFFEKLLVPSYVKPRHIPGADLSFDPEACLGCGVCAAICPARALVLGDRTADGRRAPPKIKETSPGMKMCVACCDCQAACRTGAIKVARGYQTTRLFKRISQAAELTFPKKY